MRAGGPPGAARQYLRGVGRPCRRVPDPEVLPEQLLGAEAVLHGGRHAPHGGPGAARRREARALRTAAARAPAADAPRPGRGQGAGAGAVQVGACCAPDASLCARPVPASHPGRGARARDGSEREEAGARSGVGGSVPSHSLAFQ